MTRDGLKPLVGHFWMYTENKQHNRKSDVVHKGEKLETVFTGSDISVGMLGGAAAYSAK